MNAGQHRELLEALQEQNRQLDEIRRTVNRIDGRLRDASPDRAAKIVRQEITGALKEAGRG